MRILVFILCVAAVFLSVAHIVQGQPALLVSAAACLVLGVVIYSTATVKGNINRKRFSSMLSFLWESSATDLFPFETIWNLAGYALLKEVQEKYWIPVIGGMLKDSEVAWKEHAERSRLKGRFLNACFAWRSMTAFIRAVTLVTPLVVASNIKRALAS